jgi:non-heme Fe2+,alpha-ketoglutarate-dependent halogenase
LRRIEVMGNRHLTAAQVKFYEENGYLIGLQPVFSADEVKDLNSGLKELLKLLRPGEDSKEIREWHETSKFLYDICMNDTILDYVESLLGPDFFMWGSNFFIKEPKTSSTVGWHQDAYYWPLSPQDSVTAWIAFMDSDEENGAMKVIPGSHKAGILKHQRSTATDSVLTLECEKGEFREDTAVSLVLKAGEVSLHNDKMVHGSPANHSDRRRVGLTVRYSRTEVKCDLSVNPHFKTYMCRGTDVYRNNPTGEVPVKQFGRLERKHVSVEEAGGSAEKKLWQK